MFTDSVELTLCSGKGGAGSVSFRREKFVIKGGPDGGDGGMGGDVVIKVDNNTHTLSHFRGKRVLKAKNGRPGEGRRRFGKKGESLTITLPPGTQIYDKESGEMLLDLKEGDKEIILLKGGKGGLGNWHFRSSTNQRPTYAQPGLPGECKDVRLELKLIADAGLVGFPNVGKSTLISRVSNATPEIANYEFTTLTPKLGVVNVGEFDSFVMADIPGIIEGASDGRGLGLEFLKHIERTKFLLFMLDVSNYRELDEQLVLLKKELEIYSNELSKRAYAIAITKVDTLSLDELDKKLEKFFADTDIRSSAENRYGFDKEYPYYIQDEFGRDFSKPLFVAPISSVSNINIDALKFALFDSIKVASQGV